MAGPSRYTALLDACVLYPALVRDVLLCLHVEGFYTARWSTTIEQEWVSSLLRNRPDLHRSRLEQTCVRMHRAAPDWQVTGYEELIDGLVLPDPNDRHVLAAAIRGHADCIVTTNLSDFPQAYVARFDVEVIHPDDFIVHQIDLDKLRAMAAFKAMRANLVKPPLTAERFTENFVTQGLARTATRLMDAIALL